MLRIYVMGRVMIETPSEVLESSAFPGRQGRTAFACLAVAPRRIERDRLASILWPQDLPEAWDSSLSAIISKLRRLLQRAGLDGSNALRSVDGCYEFRAPRGTWIDAREAVNALDRVEGALRRGDTGAAWGDAVVASSILSRPFLPGEPGDWAEAKRREFDEFQVRALDALSETWLLVGNHAASRQAARRAIDLAPFRESGYARLMECHLAAGNRAEAIRVYDEVKALLRDSMGISPTPEVEALYLRALG